MNFRNTSHTGYRDDSPDRNNNYNYIPSSKISMKGVSKPLTLIPVRGGKLDYNNKVIARPGDPDIDFGDAEGVFEMPYAQAQYGVIGGFQNQPYNNGMYRMDPLSHEELIRNAPMTSPANYIPASDRIVNNSQVNWNSIDNITSPEYMSNLNNATTNNLNNNLAKSDDEIIRMLKRGEVTYQQAKEAIGDRWKPEYDREDNKFTGAPNPYVSWNMDNSATMLGRSIEDGNWLGGIGAGFKLATGLARNVALGMGAANRFKESKREQEEDLRRQQDDQSHVYAQKGGLLTGDAIVGMDPDNPPVMPNAEVEAGEFLQTPDGEVTEVTGKRHSEGGELIAAPDETKVISDYVKIGAPLAKYFKKEYGVNVKAGSTFATVIDKHKRKIGLDKVIEEEANIIKKIEKQDDVKNEVTRDLNLQLLSKKLREIEEKKRPLSENLSNFTNIVFEHQEGQKEREAVKEAYKKGGKIKEYQQGGEVSEIEMMLAQYAQENGMTFEELVSQIEQLPPEEQQAFINQLAGQQPQQQAEPDLSQIIQAYAQLVGVSPEEIAQSLSQLSDQDLEAAVQQMITELQGNG